MWQLLNIIAGPLCLYILKGSSFLTSSLMSQKQARSATNEAGVMTFVCDFDNCTFEANSASSFKRHKVSHSAPSHCDFPGCFYETVHTSNLKRHSLTHSQAEREEEDERGQSYFCIACGTGHDFKRVQTWINMKKQRRIKVKLIQSSQQLTIKEIWKIGSTITRYS